MRSPFVIFLLVSNVLCHSRLQCDDSPTYSSDLMRSDIKSPGFPTRYLGLLRCTWEIEPKVDWAVSVVFEFFTTEATYDFVEINQTFPVNGRRKSVKQATLSGNNIHPIEFFSQVSGGFVIHFNTDNSENEYPGFRLSFQRFQPAPHRFVCPPVYALATETHQHLPAFSSGAQLPRTSCPFYVTVDDKGVAELLIVDVGEGLRVEIYDQEFRSLEHDSPTAPLYTFNGYSMGHTPQRITTGEKLLILIVTVIAPSRGAELEVVYYRGVDPCSCGLSEVEVNTTGRFLTSPNFPGTYCNDLHCSSRVRADPAMPHPPPRNEWVIQLKIKTFDVEAAHDLFELITGNRVLKVLTPFDETTSRQIDTFTFDTTDVTIKFTTDHSVVQTGYNVTAKLIARPQICRCPPLPGVVNFIPWPPAQSSFSFVFPPNCFMDCFWDIRPPIQFTAVRLVINMSIALGYDEEFLEIYREGGNAQNYEVERVTAAMVPTTGNNPGQHLVVLVENEPARIWYHRGSAVDADPSISRLLKVDYYWLESCECGPMELEAEDKWARKQSPEYPRPYCDLMNCTFVIRALEDKQVVINVTLLDLEHNLDTLSFYDGSTCQAPRVELLTGVIEMQNLIKSTGNTMTVIFSSDSSISWKGFEFLYRAESPVLENEPVNWSGRVRQTVGVLALIGLMVCIGYIVRRYDLTSRLPQSFILQRLLPSRSWIPFNNQTADTNRDGFAVWSNSHEHLAEEE